MNALSKSLEYLATGRGQAACIRLDRTLVSALWLHLPIVVVLAAYFERSSWIFAVVAMALIALPPTLLTLLAAGSALTRTAIGIAIMACSALLIHLSGGMIEYHFHIFVFLAVLSSYRDFRVVVASAAFVAAHHLLFNYLIPTSLFPYGTNLNIVILHAIFVVVETAYLVFDIMIRSNEFDFVETVRSVSGKLNHASQQMASVTEQISGNAQDQAASIEEIAAGMTEIGRQTELNAENVRETTAVMARVREQVDNGSQRMSQLVSSMEQVEQDSKNMANILKVIDSIAFQTNLLALNAAVEAARAGSSGKGFAVVAEEVRNLASRSAEASRNIAALVDTTLGKIGSSVQSADGASALFAKILEGVMDCERRLQAVLTSSEQQSRGTAQVGEGLNHIEVITQKNSSQAMGGADVASALRRQAEELQEMLDGFTKASSNNGRKELSLAARIESAQGTRLPVPHGR